MEKVLDSNKGIILFYLIVAILALIWALRIDKINTQTRVNTATVIERKTVRA